MLLWTSDPLESPRAKFAFGSIRVAIGQERRSVQVRFARKAEVKSRQQLQDLTHNLQLAQQRMQEIKLEMRAVREQIWL